MRRLSALFCAALLGGTAATGSGHAQDGINQAEVREAIGTALANIQHARCGAEFCAVASPAEIAEPPLEVAEAADVIERGMISAAAKACGADWIKASFQPMMDYWRAQKKDERQIALIGILHGMALGQTEALIGSKPCSDEMRTMVEAKLPAFP